VDVLLRYGPCDGLFHAGSGAVWHPPSVRHDTVPCHAGYSVKKTLKRQLVYCLLTCSKMLSFSLPHLFNALFIIPLASKAVTRGGTDHSNNNKIFPPLPLNFGYDLELYCVKMHHHARLLGQWSFLVRKLLYENTHTHTHTWPIALSA